LYSNTSQKPHPDGIRKASWSTGEKISLSLVGIKINKNGGCVDDGGWRQNFTKYQVTDIEVYIFFNGVWTEAGASWKMA